MEKLQDTAFSRKAPKGAGNRAPGLSVYSVSDYHLRCEEGAPVCRAKIGAALATKRQITGCATAPATFSGGVLTDSNGMTLITFDKDKEPGEHTGEGVGTPWHVIKEPGGSMGGY